MNSLILRTFFGRGLLVILAMSISACGSAPPVQEMSDARQAIAVAKDAGADQVAASDMAAAEEYLESAELKLSERSYSQAREYAVRARLKAQDALAIAEEPDSDGEP